MKNMKPIAMFMICLVITLPIYSSYVNAQINQVKAYGDNQNEGYRRGYDQTIINAILDVADVAASQVTVEGTEFSSCDNVDSGSSCFAEFDYGVVAGGTFPYTVRYAGDTLGGDIVVDDQDPKVLGLHIKQESDGTHIIYHVKENAYSGECGELKRIEFTSDNQLLKVKEGNLTVDNNCMFPGVGQEDEVVVNISGTAWRNICVIPYDAAGNTGETCQDFYVDNSPPILANLQVLDQGELLTYIAPVRGPIPVTVEVQVTEMNLTEISADLSALTAVPILKSQYADVNFECIPESCNGTCVCKSEETIDLQLASGGQVIVPFYVEDSNGNIANPSLTYTFNVDSSAPVVKSIEAYLFNGTNYVGPEYNVLKAHITETGSGLSEANVFLDLSQLMGSDYDTTMATECNFVQDEWVCEWRGVTAENIADGSRKTIAVVYPSQDDAGNPVQGITEQVTIDAVGPQLINHTILATGTFGGYPVTLAKEGDFLTLATNIEDVLPIRAFTNFYYVANTGFLEGDCAGPNADLSQCGWPAGLGTGPVRVGVNQRLPVYMVDAVGNNNTEDISVTVYGVETGVADYWDAQERGVSPSQIDRSMVEAYDPFVYQHIKLVKRTAHQTYPVDVKLIDCAGASGYFASGHLINYNDRDGLDISEYHIYILHKMERNAPDSGGATRTCKLKIITKVDGGRLSAIEEEVIPITVDYYDGPFGGDTIDVSIQKEIDDAKGSAIVKMKWLDTAKKIIDYSKVICGLALTLQTLSLIFPPVKDALKFIGDKIPIIGPLIFGASTVSTGLVVEAAKEGTKKFWKKLANTYCKMINCGLMQGTWIGAIQEKLNDLFGWVYVWASLSGVAATPPTGDGYALNAKASGLKAAQKGKAAASSGALEESIVWSILFLCIPGIIYNAQKYREIQCQYILCLESTAEGTPPNLCSAQKSFMTCKYVFGQIFNIIPFARAISDIGRGIARMLASPRLMVDAGFKIACWYECVRPPDNSNLPPFCTACTIKDYVDLFTDITCDLFGISYDGKKKCNSFVDKFKSLKVDGVCKEVFKDEEEEA